MKKIFLLCVFVALVAVGCRKDPKPTPQKEYVVIGFEDAELLMHQGGLPNLFYDNILWGKPYAEYDENYGCLWFDDLLYVEDIIGIGSFYCDDWGYDNWAGFAISNSHSLTLGGMDAQFSVAAPASTKFAVGYYDGGFSGAVYGAVCATPTIFVSGTKTFTSVEFANNAWTYQYALAANSTELWYTITVTGYLNGELTGEVVVELVKNGVPQAGWKEVSLTALGEVDTITFTADSSDSNDYGLLIPAYFCIDNLKYEK